MNYLKLYESFNEIDKICRKYSLDNYTINDDGSIDVNGDVDLSYKVLIKLPLRFGKVSGDFSCRDNQLTSLDGCPRQVGGYFDCCYNELTSLEGCPKEVGGSFNCDNNYLTSLECCPKKVGGYFDCNSNYLTSLEGCPKHVGGDFYCYNNKLTSLEGCPSQIGGFFYCKHNPVSVVYELIEDIVKKDYYNLIEFVENWDVIRPNRVIILDRLNDYLENFGADPVTSVEGYKCI